MSADIRSARHRLAENMMSAFGDWEGSGGGLGGRTGCDTCQETGVGLSFIKHGLTAADGSLVILKATR